MFNRAPKILSCNKNKNNEYVKDPEYRMEYKNKDHRCWRRNEMRFIDL